MCCAWNAREALLPLIYQTIRRNLTQKLNNWFYYQGEENRFGFQVELGNFYQYTYHHHQCLAQGQVLLANSGTKAAILPKGRSPTANSGTKLAVLLRINRCDSFPLLSAAHSLFSIWTDLWRSEKIPGAWAWRWGEWIWLTGPSGLHRNSPQGTYVYLRFKGATTSQVFGARNEWVWMIMTAKWNSGTLWT